MSESALTRVLVERERLRARIEGQRGELGHRMQALSRPAAIVDRIRWVGRFVRAHPCVMVAGLAAAFVLRGRRLLGLATRILAVWRLARRARALLHDVRY